MSEIEAKIGGQPLSDSYGRRQLKYYARMIKEEPHLIMKDLGTKDGLTMYELPGIGFSEDRVFVLYDSSKGNCVAYSALEDSFVRKGYKTMYNLYVDKDYRGKKLATVLHLGALHVYRKLMSDTTMALGALLAFKSLEKFGYKIKMWDTKAAKTIPFTWGPDSIPIVGGKSIEDSEAYALYV